MSQLFLSMACDYCDFGPSQSQIHRGFVVFGGVINGEEYVFRSRADAERWKSAAGREGYTIREVGSLTPFRWHLSRGTLRDVVLADSMFQVFPDFRYEPLPHRCFLMPESSSPEVSANQV